MAQEGISIAITTTWPINWTINWTIKNFTKLPAEELNSDVFVVGGYKWYLSAYPKGIKEDDHLSLFLNVADSSTFPDGWSINIESYSITVVNQVHAKDSIKMDGTEHRFDAQSPRWGFPSFMRLSNLSDPAKGYLVNDTLFVQVSVSVSDGSFSNLLNESKNLLMELSSTNRTQRSTSSSEISDPQSLQQLRKALQDFLALSLEDIDQANAFIEIARISLLLFQQSSNSLEKTILIDLISRLAAFKQILPITKSTIEDEKALRISLAGKSADVGVRVDQDQERLCALETKFSNLAAAEMKLEAEILRLTTEKEELLIVKNSVALELEKANEQASKDLVEWRYVSKETEEADKKWLQTREKLAHANLSVKLLKQNLQLCQKA